MIGGTTYYVANQEQFDNYGTYYYYDNSTSYWKPKTVTISWKNYDGSWLQMKNSSGTSVNATYTMNFNNRPTWIGSPNPSRSSSNSNYYYEWTGWDTSTGNTGEAQYGLNDGDLPLLDDDVVSGDAVTFYAHFDQKYYQYSITFKNQDGSILERKLWNAGTVPSYSGGTPTQAPTASTVYTFSGWNTTPEAVTAAAEYTAQYTPTTRQYDVTFLDYDNTELHTEKVNYDTKSTYAVEPTRTDPADTYIYDFAGWKLQGSNTTGLQTVTSDQIYVAQYTSRLKWFTITFRDWDGSIIQSGNVLNGGTITAPSPNPTRPDDAQYVYSFTGWSPAFSATATESKTYTAQYTPTTT